MTTTENIEIDSDGFACENAAQEDGKCSDYEMRACCEGTVSRSSIGLSILKIPGLEPGASRLSMLSEKAYDLRYIPVDPSAHTHSKLGRRTDSARCLQHLFYLNLGLI